MFESLITFMYQDKILTRWTACAIAERCLYSEINLGFENGTVEWALSECATWEVVSRSSFSSVTVSSGEEAYGCKVLAGAEKAF